MTAEALESAVCATHSCGSPLSECDRWAVVSLLADGQSISVVAYHDVLGAGTALALASLL
jgi:hypothetical protein